MQLPLLSNDFDMAFPTHGCNTESIEMHIASTGVYSIAYCFENYTIRIKFKMWHPGSQMLHDSDILLDYTQRDNFKVNFFLIQNITVKCTYIHCITRWYNLVHYSTESTFKTTFMMKAVFFILNLIVNTMVILFYDNSIIPTIRYENLFETDMK